MGCAYNIVGHLKDSMSYRWYVNGLSSYNITLINVGQKLVQRVRLVLEINIAGNGTTRKL